MIIVYYESYEFVNKENLEEYIKSNLSLNQHPLQISLLRFEEKWGNEKTMSYRPEPCTRICKVVVRGHSLIM